MSTEEVLLNTKLTAGVEQFIVAALEVQYQVKNGTEIHKTGTIEIEAKPGTNQEYRILWKEVWVEGKIILKNSNEESMEIPYSIRRSLQSAIDNPVDLGCK